MSASRRTNRPDQNFRALAIVQAAVYDAAVAVNPIYTPYLFSTAAARAHIDRQRRPGGSRYAGSLVSAPGAIFDAEAANHLKASARDRRSTNN